MNAEICSAWWQGRQIRFALVPVKMLNIDRKYQRDMSERHVDRLVDEWEPLRFYPIVCNERTDGSIWVINGQHSKEAALRHLGPEAYVPAMIWMHLTVKEESNGWMGNSGTRNTTMLQQHNASLIAETDPLAKQIDDLLASKGLEVKHGTYNGIKGIGTLRRVVQTYGVDVLDNVLDLLIEAYGIKKDTWSAPLIEALAQISVEYPELSKKRRLVIAALQDWGHPRGDVSMQPDGMSFTKNGTSHMDSLRERGTQAFKVKKYFIVKYNINKRVRIAVPE